MKVRRIILVVAGAAALVLVVILLSEVRRKPTSTLSHGDRARAPTEQRGSRPTAVTDRTDARARAFEPDRQAGNHPQRDAEAVAKPPPTLSPTDDDDSYEAEDNARIEEATGLYESGDYSAAAKLAEEFLGYRPRNNKMLWIMFSSSCATKNVEAAREWFEELHVRYWKEAREHCAGYGVEIGKITYD
jgi:hypothetical protein